MGSARSTVLVTALAVGVAGCAGFKPEPASGTYQPYSGTPPVRGTTAVAPAPAPAGPAGRLRYTASTYLLGRCAAPLELAVRSVFGERNGSEVTVVLEAIFTNPHAIPVTLDRNLHLRAGGGVELPFWNQFDRRRGRAVAASGGGVVLLPIDLRENDAFTGQEQRTLPAGASARTPTVTYKGLLGRGEELTLELYAASSAARGDGCRYRVKMNRR
jgi:hypothetical protein